MISFRSSSMYLRRMCERDRYVLSMRRSSDSVVFSRAEKNTELETCLVQCHIQRTHGHVIFWLEWPDLDGLFFLIVKVCEGLDGVVCCFRVVCFSRCLLCGGA